MRLNNIGYGLRKTCYKDFIVHRAHSLFPYVSCSTFRKRVPIRFYWARFLLSRYYYHHCRHHHHHFHHFTTTVTITTATPPPSPLFNVYVYTHTVFYKNKRECAVAGVALCCYYPSVVVVVTLRITSL